MELVEALRLARRTDNAGPEWQAGSLERKLGIGGGLPTQGACYTGQ